MNKDVSLKSWSYIFLPAGKKLSDLERVTSLKVYNWFANRRKEIKRRANIGNVALLFVLLFKMEVQQSYAHVIFLIL